ncbi:MAG TPA: hypothetical protein VI197_18795, partial [Polyangiaceae bacterium]
MDATRGSIFGCSCLLALALSSGCGGKVTDGLADTASADAGGAGSGGSGTSAGGSGSHGVGGAASTAITNAVTT